MPHPKVKISDDSGNTVDVTSNALDVNIAGGSASIDLGDVDMFLDGGTAILGNTGTIAAGVLRVTLATDDTLGGVIYADDADWTDSSSKHILTGGLYQAIPQTVTAGDVAPLAINDKGRLRVETEQDDAFTTWVTYQAFAVPTGVTGTAISADSPNGTGAEIGDAKEIMIQVDSANEGYIMVGGSAATCVPNATVTNRKGIKLVGGETLVIAIGDFTKVFLVASESNQHVYVAYFK
jgi:hypothetical protein